MAKVAAKSRQRPTPCNCGHWPHGMGCAFLRWCANQRKKGICSQCGAKILSERGGQVKWCPNGCSREISGEAFLELMDATGSGWIREVVESEQRKGTPRKGEGKR